MGELEFEISIPTDSGYVGRECNNADCGRYFKIYKDSLREQLFCPYCGEQFDKNELLTQDQTKFIKEVATEEAKEVMVTELHKMFGNLAKSGPDKFKASKKPYRKKNIVPDYSEKQVDSELNCPVCDMDFQVYGIFGFCPGCKLENILVYDVNLEIIKMEVKQSSDTQRALRHAYSDIVSTFEIYCRKKAKAITSEIARFQNITETRRFFKKIAGIDIFKGLSNQEMLLLRRVFQKRHLFEHDEGLINEKYIKNIPEDAKLLGQQAELTIDELCSAANYMHKALDNLSRGLGQ